MPRSNAPSSSSWSSSTCAGGPRRAGCWRVAFAAAGLGLACGAGQAAPVDHDSPAGGPDPYELAARWTSAGLAAGSPGAPLAAWPAAVPVPLPGDRPTAPSGLRFTALPMAGGDAGVPDPGSYALMGLLLLAAGLAVHQLRRGRGGAQRGFSKKT